MEIHVSTANIYLLKRARGLTFVRRVCSELKVRIALVSRNFVSCVSVEKHRLSFFFLFLFFFTSI